MIMLFYYLWKVFVHFYYLGLYNKTCYWSADSLPGPVCGKDWVKPMRWNFCYYISKDRTTWEKSRQRCQRKGADLVVIDSEMKQVNQSINQANFNKHNFFADPCCHNRLKVYILLLIILFYYCRHILRISARCTGLGSVIQEISGRGLIMLP